MDMVYEVRRQFKEIAGIMEGKAKPDYGRCVEISTKAALREMMLPGILTIGFPILIVIIGILVYSDNHQLVAEMLGGYMAGVTVSGVLWAIFQNNAGGAWDNAKKSFEAGVEINGEMTYKGSDAHKAAVTGDTVGDPFKDTSGPSMNILIKLTCLVGLVVAPILGNHAEENSDVTAVQSSVSASDEYAESVDTEGNFIYNVGENNPIRLSSGKELIVGRRSTEQKFYRFISDPNIEEKMKRASRKGHDKSWITLDRVNFKSGSSELMPISKEQLANISLLMKEFPDAKIKIGGYTDNTGDEDINLKISTERANIVKANLVKMGVDDSRMQSEGYGASHFICEPNDSDICKAKNRRVDIKIVSK